MKRPLASVVIPAHNHAKYLGDAMASVIAQTIDSVELIVVNDGSTDSTAEDLTFWDGDPRVRVFQQPHRGPCSARNAGLALATGEYVMFLDADDLIYPDKIERQVAALKDHPACGWCLCDTFIRDEVSGTQEHASTRYDYVAKDLGGWVYPQLQGGNFIPIMAPLMRRELIAQPDGIRFDSTKLPEDWFFWMDVARRARLCYIPYVGAVYEHRRTGRSRIPKTGRRPRKNGAPDIRLNLGCGTEGTRSWHPVPGFVNLDKSMGWQFEDGLGEFADGTVAGITVSHALMYVPIEKYGDVLREFVRVLKPGGVVRVTEDSCYDPASSRFGGWQGSDPAVTLTFPELFLGIFGAIGLEPHRLRPTETRFVDDSLIQQQHGDPPDVFFVEGVKRA